MNFRRIIILATGFFLIASGIVWSQQYNTSGGWYGSDTRRAASTTDHLGLGVVGDASANDRYQLRADGQMSWGSGSGVPDVDLARTAAGVLGLPAGDRFNAPLFGDAAGDDTLNIGGTDDTVTLDSNDAAGTYDCTDADANSDCTFAGGGTGIANLGDANNTSVALVTDGAGFTVDLTSNAAVLTATTTVAASFIGADASSPADTILDTTGAGNITIGSADVLVVTITTDDTGDGTDLVLPANAVDASEINGVSVCGAHFWAEVDPTESGATPDFLSLWDHGGSTTEGNEDLYQANPALLNFHSMSCVVDVAPGAGDDWLISLREAGGAPTSGTVTCRIDDTNVSCVSTDTAAVASGALLNLDIESDTGATDPAAAALLTCSLCAGH